MTSTKSAQLTRFQNGMREKQTQRDRGNDRITVLFGRIFWKIDVAVIDMRNLHSVRSGGRQRMRKKYFSQANISEISKNATRCLQ